jgi:hypothetical protein
LSSARSGQQHDSATSRLSSPFKLKWAAATTTAAVGVPLIWGIRVLSVNLYRVSWWFSAAVRRQHCGCCAPHLTSPPVRLWQRPSQQCRPLLDVVWMRGQPLFCADYRVAWTSCNCRSAVLEMLCSFDHVLDVSATQMPVAVLTSVCSDYSESFYFGAML